MRLIPNSIWFLCLGLSCLSVKIRFPIAIPIYEQSTVWKIRFSLDKNECSFIQILFKLWEREDEDLYYLDSYSHTEYLNQLFYVVLFSWRARKVIKIIHVSLTTSPFFRAVGLTCVHLTEFPSMRKSIRPPPQEKSRQVDFFVSSSIALWVRLIAPEIFKKSFFLQPGASLSHPLQRLLVWIFRLNVFVKLSRLASPFVQSLFFLRRMVS